MNYRDQINRQRAAIKQREVQEFAQRQHIPPADIHYRLAELRQLAAGIEGYPHMTAHRQVLLAEIERLEQKMRNDPH